jgi:hypothetical protein
MFSIWRRKPGQKGGFRWPVAVRRAARSHRAVPLRWEEALQDHDGTSTNAAAHIGNNHLEANNGSNTSAGPATTNPALLAVPGSPTPAGLPLTNHTLDNRLPRSAHDPGRAGRQSRGRGRSPRSVRPRIGR